MIKIKKEVVSAPFLKRLLAFMIDMALMFIFIIPSFQKIIIKMVPQDVGSAKALLESQPILLAKINMIMVMLFSFIFFYFAYAEWKYGQTFGKMIVKLRVVSDYGELSFWQSALRTLFIFPVFPLILLWIIDPAFMIFSSTKRRLSEILSKTWTQYHGFTLPNDVDKQIAMVLKKKRKVKK